MNKIHQYVSIHTHSDYSARDGAQSCNMIAKKAASDNMEAVAITDHGVCSGLLTFKKACEKHKVRSIYGNEFYVAPFEHTRKEKIENFKPSYHMVCLAKNNTGVRNMFKLTSLSWTEGFYFRPRIDLNLLNEYKEGLIVTAGCMSGFAPQMILNNREEEARDYLIKLRDMFKDDFYIEVQNHGLDFQKPLNKKLFEFGRELSISVIATQDSHYNNREDALLHKHITKLASGNLEFEGEEIYFKTSEEFSQMWEEDELFALDETLEVAKKCKSEWEFGKTIWPVYDLPNNITPEQELRRKAYEGFNKLFSNPTDEYKERIKYELSVIEKMGFSTYFLVVADFINWAENNDIMVGPGRGSAAGSLVCYTIGITKLDPIKYGLYFERFLSPTRVSLPDVDSDTEPSGRQKIIEYFYSKYGKEKCAQIATYSTFKPRGALVDFTRTFGYPIQVGKELSALIPADKSGRTCTFDEAIKDEPRLLTYPAQDVVEIARKAEGLIKQTGIHAAGVVISNEDIGFTVPLYGDNDKGKEVVAQFDKDQSEEIGLVKLDLLGLRNLSVIKDTIRLIKKKKNTNININNINLEDQNIYENIFQKGKLDGIFQFENSSGFKDLCYKVKPKSIEDLSAITSLYRPGPLSAKLTDKYVERKSGAVFEYEIPELEPILNTSQGVMVFQEQIMRICTDVAGYTLSEADEMRRIIGKKKIEKMKEERTKFISGCTKNNINKNKAEQLFNDIEGFAAYSFNLAHAASYSVISYQTAWLKNYYPVEFYTALLNNCDNNQDRIIKYIYAARDEEIIIQPPDVNKSEVGFTTDGDNTIVFGFEGIKGIGAKAAQVLIDIRNEKGSFKDLDDFLTSGLDKRLVNALANCGALESITDLTREQLVENIDSIIKYHKNIKNWEEKRVKYLERQKEIEIWEQNKEGKKPRASKLKDKPEFPIVSSKTSITKKEKLKLEKETLGFYLTGNPLDDHYGLLDVAKYNIEKLRNGDVQNKEKVVLPIIISNIKKIRTRSDKNMANLIVEDKTGRISVTVFPKTWTNIKDNIIENEVYIMSAFAEVTQSEEEGSIPIVNLIATDIKKIKGQSITIMPIVVKLNDSSCWEFIPSETQDINLWKRADVMAKNLRKQV